MDTLKIKIEVIRGNGDVVISTVANARCGLIQILNPYSLPVIFEDGAYRLNGIQVIPDVEQVDNL